MDEKTDADFDAKNRTDTPDSEHFRMEKRSEAYTSAIYNAIAITVIAMCLGLCFLLFSVLQIFMRSIFWSILTSAFVFPVKKYLTDLSLMKFQSIEKSKSIMTLELALLPIKLIDSFVDYTYSFIRGKLTQILILILTATVLNLAYSFNDSFFDYSFLAISFTSDNLAKMINYVDNNWIISLTFVLVYFLTVGLYWQNEYRLVFKIFSLPVWLVLFLLASKLLGQYRALFMTGFILLTLIGVFSSAKEMITSNFSKIDMPHFFNKIAGSSNKVSLKKNQRKDSDIYFILLFWFFIYVNFRIDFYIAIPLIILVWKTLKFVCWTAYSFLATNSSVLTYADKLNQWTNCRKDALLPKPFVMVIRFFQLGDRKLNGSLQNSIDNIIALLMIISLIVFMVVSLIFLVIQIQAESIELIGILSSIVNQNLYSKPEMSEWLPEKNNLSKIYQAGVHNVYLYGKDWLLNTFRSTFKIDSESQLQNKSDYLILETQILQHWDNLYSFLSEKTAKNLSANGTRQDMLLKKKFWYMWKNKLNQTENFNLKQVMTIFKDNIGIMMSIMDSLYQFVAGNLNILVKVLYNAMSLIFASGFALINFLFSLIVYFTASFYLLSMSSDRFKPLIWLSEINFFKMMNKKSNGSEFLSLAIEESIRNVFVASLKMALFYGIYTYLLNCLFGVSIVYLPAILAAFFGFLPVFGTYWVAIPGALELWFLDNSPILSIAFVFMNLLPYLAAVDQAIYSEIKACHPYLTGLAFVGGVYLAGLEGAFIGPLVLCLIIVIGKLFTSFESNDDTKIQKLLKAVSFDN
ncbi:transmembrane protein -like [Brachionus plicatilis]|uniref:Transmembrane protein-like n=1 Tax=Brachionus plicatilis TaxID=10195 RepID=A0A3M7REG1_BRAPC|nr:transmembrane protein -like [Brachionus plicatilis]